MEPRTLDLAAYPRRAHFDYFRQMANPYLSVTAPCDITALRRLTQERGLPFFLTVLHCAINAANAVPARCASGGYFQLPRSAGRSAPAGESSSTCSITNRGRCLTSM